MLRSLECILPSDGTIRSPGVGLFSPMPAGTVSSPQQQTIGSLQRLDQRIALSIPAAIAGFSPLQKQPFQVEVGDILGTCTGNSDCFESAAHTMSAPADGFIQFGSVQGLLRQPGEPLAPGEIVAILEFMKIRMDITFDGPQNSRLIRYIGLNHRAVKSGEAFLEYEVLSSD